MKHVMERTQHFLYQTAVETGTHQYHSAEALIYASGLSTHPHKRLTKERLFVRYANLDTNDAKSSIKNPMLLFHALYLTTELVRGFLHQSASHLAQVQVLLTSLCVQP